MCWTPLYTSKHNNVNKTMNTPTGGNDESNIAFIRKSEPLNMIELSQLSTMLKHLFVL